MTNTQLVLYFAIYAFLGWCTEVLYAYYKQKKFVNRGFLHGPFCPIYGFGVLLVVLMLENVNNLILLFILSIIITSVLEYLTGYALETLFHCKWWDYSTRFLNLKGRICLKFSIFWGVVCTIIIKIIHPIIAAIVALISSNIGAAQGIIAKGIFLYFWTDLIITVISIYDFNHILQALHETTLKYETNIKNLVEASAPANDLNRLKEELTMKKEFLYKRITKNQQRLIKAFPNLKVRLPKSDKLHEIVYDILNDIKKHLPEI